MYIIYNHVIVILHNYVACMFKECINSYFVMFYGFLKVGIGNTYIEASEKITHWKFWALVVDISWI